MKKIKQTGLKKPNFLDKYNDNKYINISNNNDYIENINSKFIYNLKSSIYCNEKSCVALTDFYYFTDETINLGTIKIKELIYTKREIFNSFDQNFIDKYKDLEKITLNIKQENKMFELCLKEYQNQLDEERNSWLTGMKTKANATKNEEYKKTLLLGSLELNIKYLNESYDILNELEFKKINFLLDDSEINLSMTVIALSNKIMTHFDNLRRNLNATNSTILGNCSQNIKELTKSIEKIELLVVNYYTNYNDAFELEFRNGILIEEFILPFQKIKKSKIKRFSNYFTIEFDTKIEIELSKRFIRYFHYEMTTKDLKIYCGTQIDIIDKYYIKTNILTDNLLRIVKFDSKSFENSHKSYEALYYKSINKTFINSIKIEIKDSNIFNFCKAPNLTLHFKNIKK